MQRDGWGELWTGCCCAANLEKIPKEFAAERERPLRLRAARRKTWLTRKWRTSKKGSKYLRLDGYVAIVSRKGIVFSGMVVPKGRSYQDAKFVNGSQLTFEKAALATFDLLQEVQDVSNSSGN
jgi:hypothetical protein